MAKASRYRASVFLLILSLSCAFASSPVNKALADDVHNYGHIQISQTSKSVVVDTGPIQVTFSLASGLASYSWNKVGRISDAYSAARVGTLLKSTDYSTHRFLTSDVRRLSDGFGRGVRFSFLNTEKGKPALRQTYYLYEGKPFFLLEITLESPTAISTNWLAPRQLDKPGSVNIGSSADERVLIVPWDNDNFMRYRGETIDSAME